MSNTKAKISIFKIFTAVGFTTALFAGLFPGTARAAETVLNMGTASTYGVLAKAAITSATPSGISGTAGGDLGSGDAIAPTGTITRTGTTILGGAAITALTAASNALADNRGGTVTGVELGAGRTISPGAYTNGTLEINGPLTLDGLGDTSAVFIFRSASTLITGASSTVLLTNGARACNVFWQIGSSATLGISSTIVGHVIASTSVSTGASTTVNGQLIGTTGSVTLGGTTIVNNSCTTPTPKPTPKPTSSGTSVFIPVPVLAQDSNITSVTPIICSTSGYKVLVNGFFPTKITNIGVDGVNIARSRWTQTSSQVVITIPPTSKKSFFVRLFNGRAPVMAFQYFNCVTPVVIIPVVTPTPVATPTPTPTPVVIVTPTPTPTPVVTPTPTPTPVEEVIEPVVETVTGGKLPATSTPLGNILLVGGVLILLSGIGFASRKIRVK
ncbi:MAG: ice-binding family protein [Candidatus Planktophila sp.]|nr:ice-binding family protein [Candidatus Planktophila sp.]